VPRLARRVRTISGKIVGELVDVVPSISTGGLEVVIVQGLLGRRRRLPEELVLGANATERVIILNLGTASALDQLGSRTPSTRGNASTTRPPRTCSFCLPTVDTTSSSG
jgi:hypothetical protein